MKNPTLWTKGDLYHHLQQAIDLEFWTIPLYLTSLYSIKGLKECDKKDYPPAAILIESVVIQEMLHLEIVCNLCNALGHSPKFIPPNYDEKKGIPFIHPKQLTDDISGFEVKLGALNENSLKLFCAIELPETKRESVWNEERSYDCIAQLYDALKIGIETLWAELYVGDKNNTRQKAAFREYQNSHGHHHGFSQIVNSPESAKKAIDAIIEQGEGADSKLVPADFRPPKAEDGKEFDPGWFKGHLSHYQKFRILHHHHKKLPPIHAINPGYTPSEAQNNLKTSYSNFLKELETAFNLDGDQMPKTFWGCMFGVGQSIIEVWESGGCPDFNIDC